MRYIGPYFRMNKLSYKEINGQLFHLSKEAIRTLVLESKCGLVDSIKNYKKLSSSIDITTSTNFSPLLCIYRKSSPNYIHSKNYNGFDEESFKKEVSPTTNALLTTSILNLSTYYSRFKDVDEKLYSYSKVYKKLSKRQLEFYSVNLRDNDGFFTEKKNLSENNYKGFNLVDKNNKFKFSDQAFMMVAYNLYSILYPEDKLSSDYNSFSLEILNTLMDFKEKIYDCSFEEICKILTALNMFYSNSENKDAEILIIDLTDFLINKFDEKDYYVDSLDFTTLFALNLILAHKYTKIIAFNEKSKDILKKLLSFYDDEKDVFLKLSSKKDMKYSCFDIAFYFLALFMHAKEDNNEMEYKNIISSLYRKYFINSGIITSWPDAPTLDDAERYRGLTFNSADMLDEGFFKLSTTQSPSSSGIAPVFKKNVTYSKKKNSFSSSNSSFDSYKNLYIYNLIIFLFKDDFMLETNLLSTPSDYRLDDNDSIDDNDLEVNDEIINDNNKSKSKDNEVKDKSTVPKDDSIIEEESTIK
ncbi:hypothetical protein R0131_11640 [Clostridium sp. AL.422]|uniref:hypothetical protein n=1 Tax=Clostridium TaxID=1485 RepID=UPI00293DB436|nr:MULTISPECIES: hypothetical protein [unclassified Clostridium]MDV4151479.1 hypothetical protein [Clostridium sp. AL.422]